jgi:hypothetical protein
MIAAEARGARLTTLNPDTYVASAAEDAGYDPVTAPV